MRIAALACRSYYSLLRGSVSARRLVQKAAEYGYGAVALTDANSMYGVVDFCKAAEQAGIKPIIGVEILTDGQSVTLLAEDRCGYTNLCRITTARNLHPDFDLIGQLKNSNEGIICICSQPKLLQQLKEFVNRDYLFAGCRRPDEVERAKALAIKPVAYTNFNILDDEDVVTAGLLDRIRQLSVAGPGPEDDCGFNRLIPEEQFRRKFRNCHEAIGNAEQIIQRSGCYLERLGGNP